MKATPTSVRDMRSASIMKRLSVSGRSLAPSTSLPLPHHWLTSMILIYINLVVLRLLREWAMLSRDTITEPINGPRSTIRSSMQIALTSAWWLILLVLRSMRMRCTFLVVLNSIQRLIRATLLEMKEILPWSKNVRLDCPTLEHSGIAPSHIRIRFIACKMFNLVNLMLSSLERGSCCAMMDLDGESLFSHRKRTEKTFIYIWDIEFSFNLFLLLWNIVIVLGIKEQFSYS